MLVPAYFNPRSPDGERPSSARACRTSHVISIHAPRVGSDIKESSIHVPNRRFQSTLPGWGATQQRRHPVQQGRISIHAPRVGSDPPPCRSCCPGRYFNPRSPGGERPATEINRLWPQLFQSTLPGWGATGDGNQPTVATAISIHAPRVGSDAGHPVPARLDGRISIHAPRMGSDNEQEVAKTEAETFQSTLPGWGATRIGGFDGSVFKFQSTLPGWGATHPLPRG